MARLKGDGASAREHALVRAPPSSLHQLRAQSRLYRLLLQSEAARGYRYASVVWSRLDFFWLRPHPPLRLLSICCRSMPIMPKRHWPDSSMT